MNQRVPYYPLNSRHGTEIRISLFIIHFYSPTACLQISSQIRRLIKEVYDGAQSLKLQLETLKNVTSSELQRREDLLVTLRTRNAYFETAFNKSTSVDNSMNSSSRSALLSGNGGRQPQNYGGSSDSAFDGSEALKSQQQQMEQQDVGLNALSESLARQKQLGYQISGELDDQNKMLDDIDEGMTNTGSRLRRVTKHVEYISEKTKTTGMMCCICLLILAIILVQTLL